MNIARPATGFIITEPAHFAEYLAERAAEFPRVLEQWEGLKERLKMTAHREGAAFGGPGERVFEAEGDARYGIPVIRVAYHVLGDQLSFKKIVVLPPTL